MKMNFLNIFKKKKSKSIDVLDKEEIESQAKLIPKKESDEEPSWYHYVIVLLVLFGIIGLLYGGFEIYDKYYSAPNQEIGNMSTTYNYPYKVGNITYNIQMNYPIETIKNFTYPLEVSKYDILNSIELIMTFKEYNGTDNGKVTIAGSKLTTFFKRVYHFSFEPEVNFKTFNETTCLNSTKQNKVIIYDIYSNKSGVFYDKDSGCIEIQAQNAEEIIKITDYFMYNLINE